MKLPTHNFKFKILVMQNCIVITCDKKYLNLEHLKIVYLKLLKNKYILLRGAIKLPMNGYFLTE